MQFTIKEKLGEHEVTYSFDGDFSIEDFKRIKDYILKEYKEEITKTEDIFEDSKLLSIVVDPAVKGESKSSKVVVFEIGGDVESPEAKLESFLEDSENKKAKDNEDFVEELFKIIDKMLAETPYSKSIATLNSLKRKVVAKFIAAQKQES